MQLVAKGLQKRFNRHIIFQEVDLTLSVTTKLAVLGPNGSGKSTLLKCLSGYAHPSKGSVYLEVENEKEEVIAPHVAICAPYSGLIEEYTLTEMINFYQQFKPFKQGINTKKFLSITELEAHRHKFLSQFSSGMKQRVKLGLALLSDVPFVLLDEPTSNLDEHATTWYRQLVEHYSQNSGLVICTNQPQAEASICTSQLNILQHKPAN